MPLRDPTLHISYSSVAQLFLPASPPPLPPGPQPHHSPPILSPGNPSSTNHYRFYPSPAHYLTARPLAHLWVDER